jgi:hypothetical protein
MAEYEMTLVDRQRIARDSMAFWFDTRGVDQLRRDADPVAGTENCALHQRSCELLAFFVTKPSNPNDDCETHCLRSRPLLREDSQRPISCNTCEGDCEGRRGHTASSLLVTYKEILTGFVPTSKYFPG